jgi:hypothetical protein
MSENPVPKITKELVRELVKYEPRTGKLTWRRRARKWFTSDAYWRRWNNRYAMKPAFTYTDGEYRWGSLFNTNMLAHRVVWMYVHGSYPKSIGFKNGDATDLRLANLYDGATRDKAAKATVTPIKRVQLPRKYRNPHGNERVRIAA